MLCGAEAKSWSYLLDLYKLVFSVLLTLCCSPIKSYYYWLLFATIERAKYLKNISPRKRLIADIYARLLTDIGVGDCAQVQVYRTVAWFRNKLIPTGLFSWNIYLLHPNCIRGYTHLKTLLLAFELPRENLLAVLLMQIVARFLIRR